MWIRDVEDVDVGRFEVVGHHEVGVLAGIPCKRAVRVVRVGKAAVAEVLREFERLERVGDVVEGDATFPVLPALLVVRREHLAAEELGRDLDDLHPLARTRVLRVRDEVDQLRVRDVGDIDDVNAGVGRVLSSSLGVLRTIGLAPVREEDPIPVWRHREVGDEVGRVRHVELADELDVPERAGTKQVPLVAAVLAWMSRCRRERKSSEQDNRT